MTSTASNDNMASLREQILANAVHVFPVVVKQHRSYSRFCETGIVPANEVFDIVISFIKVRAFLGQEEKKEFQAYLTFSDPQDPANRRMALQGHKKESAEEALNNLLEATGQLVLLGGRQAFGLSDVYEWKADHNLLSERKKNLVG